MVETAKDQEHRKWVIAALERYECRLTRYAIRLVGDEDAARDAVQHAFLRLCSAERSDVAEHLAAWLYTVCRNKALDMLRSRQHLRSLEVRSWGTSSSGDVEPASRDADPAATVEAADLAAWIRQLLDELSHRQREVVDLLLDGFSYSQIADITGRSTGNTRVIAHRAIARLREHPQVRELLLPVPSRHICSTTDSTLRTSS